MLSLHAIIARNISVIALASVKESLSCDASASDGSTSSEDLVGGRSTTADGRSISCTLIEEEGVSFSVNTLQLRMERQVFTTELNIFLPCV